VNGRSRGLQAEDPDQQENGAASEVILIMNFRILVTENKNRAG
jgi:hypothetical protein